VLKELLNALLREVNSEKLLPLPQSFYDVALSYVHSLKLRKNNEVGELQRRIWEEEIALLEKTLSIIKNVRARKIMLEAMDYRPLEKLPPEEEVYYLNLRKALELAKLELAKTEVGLEGSMSREEGKVLLLLKRGLDEALAEKLGLPKLEPEDVIFINKQTGKVLIDLGIAEEISVR
jgi:DNA replication initiation complex subunit (GINS family)